MDAVCTLSGGRVLLRECLNKKFCNQLRSAGALKGEVVDPLEAAYQLVRGRIHVEGLPEGWIGGIKLVSAIVRDPDLFLVYYDLRRRGRRVMRGLRRRTLIVARGGDKELEVLVLSEGTHTTFRDIAEWSKLASRDGFIPVVAVVDGYGVVTYYEARSARSLS